MKIPEHIYSIYETATCLYTKNEVEKAFDHMAQAIRNALQDSNPLVLCVMIGGMVPTVHLLERIDFPLELDYVHATRYQGETSGKELVWKRKPSTVMQNRTVLIVDDILDGGITLQEIVSYCKAEQASKIYTAVLVDKQGVRLSEGLPQADFTGLQVENRYVFGYGLDYKEYLRNAPGIYAVAEGSVK